MLFRRPGQFSIQPSQVPQQPLPAFLRRRMRTAAMAAAAATASRIRMSKMFMADSFGQNRDPIRRMTRAAIQAMAHCQRTTPSAHLRPISRRMAAMAATQGV